MVTSQIIESVSLLGKCDPMQQLYKMIGRVCNVDCAVLLIGERGSGKGVTAQALHFFSHRAAAPFLTISGTGAGEATDEELLGFDMSHQSEATVYITDYTSMSAFQQLQLVSIHRNKEYRCSHIGKLRKHNLRFVVSGNEFIGQELESGRFSQDLFYDWNFLPLYIPPLRERKEDIPLLASHFLDLTATEMKVSRRELSPEALEILMAHDWPGNISELKAALRIALSNCRGNYIRAEHLPSFSRQTISGPEAFQQLKMFLDSRLSSYIRNSPASLPGNLYRLLLPEIERSLFQYALKRSNGNRNQAAELLGLHRNTLNKKLHSHS